MAKIISVNDNFVSCELNNGALRRYERKFFAWDVLPGDEFRFIKKEDGKIQIERISPREFIAISDLEEDNIKNASPQRSMQTQSKAFKAYPGIVCPRCGSNNITIETIQENRGSTTVSRTKGKSRMKGHGILWWISIGWIWWIVDLMLWIFAFVPRLILRLFAAPWKKRERIEKSKTITRTNNHIRYIKICTCQNCGNSWRR